MAGFHPVAFGYHRRIGSFLRSTPNPRYKSLLQVSKFNLRHLDQRGSRTNGSQQLLLVFGNQDKQRFLRGLFKKFQQLVGGVNTHLLRHPDDGDFILSFVGLETQFTEQRGRIAYRDVALLVFHFQKLIPRRGVHIAFLLEHIVAPFRHEQIRFRIAFHAFGRRGRHHKMHIRMRQLADLLTAWANSTTIRCRTMRTKDVLRVGQGQRQFSVAFRTQKQLGMRHTVLLHTEDQLVFHFLLADDVFELHRVVFQRAKIMFFSLLLFPSMEK